MKSLTKNLKIKKDFLNILPSLSGYKSFDLLVEKKKDTLFVINKKKKLLGVVTLGDFRKALLLNKNFNLVIKKLMNKNFKYLNENFTKEEAFKILNKNSMIVDIPILNKNKKIISILSRSKIDLKNRNLNKVSLVVMAGGIGKRLRPFTHMIPKPLMPINNKTLIQEIIDRFIKFKVKNTFVITNYKKNILKSLLLLRYKNINVIEEKNYLGTFGGLKFLQGKLSDDFILTNCDTVLDFNYNEALQLHKKKKFDITLISALKKSKIPYGVCEIDRNSNLKGILEKPLVSNLINCGMYILNKNIFKNLKKNKKIDATDFINQNLNNLKIGTFQIHEKQFKDYGQIKDYFNVDIT